MEIREEKLEGGIAVVSLGGRLDAGAVVDTEKELLRIIGQSPKALMLDLAGLDYISSAGLRVLLTAAKTMRTKGGKLHVFSVKRFVKEVFDISGFSSVLPLHATREDALTAASR
jgi:anti-sigma B factor antagonist